MSMELPQGFSHQYLCRACVKREGVTVSGAGFLVTCNGQERQALRRSECATFRLCPHRSFLGHHQITIENGFSRPVLSSAQLQELHRFASGLDSSLNLEERQGLIEDFEANLLKNGIET